MARIIDTPWGPTRVIEQYEFEVPRLRADALALCSMSTMCSISFITMLVAYLLGAKIVAAQAGQASGAFFLLMVVTFLVLVAIEKPE